MLRETMEKVRQMLTPKRLLSKADHKSEERTRQSSIHSRYDQISSTQKRLPPSQLQTPQVNKPLTTISSETGQTIRHGQPFTPKQPRPSSRQCNQAEIALLKLHAFRLLVKWAKDQDEEDPVSQPTDIVKRLLSISDFIETLPARGKDTLRMIIENDSTSWIRQQEELQIERILVSEKQINDQLVKTNSSTRVDVVSTQTDSFTEPSNNIITDSDTINEMKQQIVEYKEQCKMLERKLQVAEQALKEERMESTKTTAAPDAEEDKVVAKEQNGEEDIQDGSEENVPTGHQEQQADTNDGVTEGGEMMLTEPPTNGGDSSALSDDNEEAVGNRDVESNTSSSETSLESSKVALQADPSIEDGVGRARDNLDVPPTNEDEPDDGDATGSENGMVSNVRRAPATTTKHRSPPQGAPPVHEVVCLSSSSRAQEVDDDSALSEAANTSTALDNPRVRGGGDSELDSDTTIGDQTSQQDGLYGESENDLSEQVTDEDENSTKDTESDSSASSSSSISRSTRSNNDYDQQSSINELDFGGDGMDGHVSSEEDHSASVSTTTSQHDDNQETCKHCGRPYQYHNPSQDDQITLHVDNLTSGKQVWEVECEICRATTVATQHVSDSGTDKKIRATCPGFEHGCKGKQSHRSWKKKIQLKTREAIVIAWRKRMRLYVACRPLLKVTAALHECSCKVP